MPGLGDLGLLPAVSAPAAVRRPVFAVSLGPGGGPAAGLGGLADVAAAVGVELPGGADPWRQHLVSLTVECGLAPGVDAAVLEVAPGPQAPAAAVGDAGSVSLGYEDGGPVVVFTGTVADVRRRLAGTTRVTLTNGGATLARLRVEQSYEQQSAGAVVRDLAGKANVTVGTAEDGIDFAFLVVDDRSSVLWHIAALARKCGHLAYLTPDDKLTFAAFKGGPAAQTFAYGVDLLAVELADAAPVAATVTVVGEGAAGANGADAWCWLVQDPAAVTTSAGSGTPERRVSDPSLRSAAAAGLAAAGLASSAGRWTTSGRLLVPGAPQATVGAVVAVKDAPQAEHNGDFLVTGVRHRYGKRTGFRTELLVSKSGAAAGGPGGLLGAAASALGGLL